MYIGTVPAISGAHTAAETIGELKEKIQEVLELCLNREVYNVYP